ncbi:MAG: hypothetical protein V4474_02660 [Patescibacteria group bacterium]
MRSIAVDGIITGLRLDIAEECSVNTRTYFVDEHHPTRRFEFEGAVVMTARDVVAHVENRQHEAKRDAERKKAFSEKYTERTKELLARSKASAPV